MFPVLYPLRQRLALRIHALYDGMVRWMKPRSTSLLLGTIADLARGKSELLVENALLRILTPRYNWLILEKSEAACLDSRLIL